MNPSLLHSVALLGMATAVQADGSIMVMEIKMPDRPKEELRVQEAWYREALHRTHRSRGQTKHSPRTIYGWCWEFHRDYLTGYTWCEYTRLITFALTAECLAKVSPRFGVSSTLCVPPIRRRMFRGRGDDT